MIDENIVLYKAEQIYRQLKDDPHAIMRSDQIKAVVRALVAEINEELMYYKRR